MKKTIVFIVLLISSLMLIFGCSKKEKPSEISFDYGEDVTAIEMPIGAFDFENNLITVTYASGRTEEIAVTPDMVSEEDRMKFYREGEHEITLNYNGATTTVKISVKRNTFGEIAFPENNVFKYDGEEHTVEVDGEIPSQAEISYPQGNTFVNAGTYDVIAVITCDGYVTKRVTTTVKIERASYDVSGLSFESKEVVYDRNPHMIEISGELPEGVSAPKYYVGVNEVKSFTNAGVYNVVAVFENSDPNYNLIPDMEATLTIKKATLDVKGLNLVFTDAKGEAYKGSSKVFDGDKVVAKIDSSSSLPAGASVSYTVKKDGDSSGNVTGTPAFVDAGRYEVTATFKLEDDKNYSEIAPLTATFEINKADYDLSKVYFDPNSLEYDGKSHSILKSGELPEGVSVSYEYYLGDERLLDESGNKKQSVSEAGKYTVKATFSHSNPNYNEIAPRSAILEITPKTISVSDMINHSEFLEFCVNENDNDNDNVTLAKVFNKILGLGDDNTALEVNYTKKDESTTTEDDTAATEDTIIVTAKLWSVHTVSMEVSGDLDLTYTFTSYYRDDDWRNPGSGWVKDEENDVWTMDSNGVKYVWKTLENGLDAEAISSENTYFFEIKLVPQVSGAPENYVITGGDMLETVVDAYKKISINCNDNGNKITFEKTSFVKEEIDDTYYIYFDETHSFELICYKVTDKGYDNQKNNIKDKITVSGNDSTLDISALEAGDYVVIIDAVGHYRLADDLKFNEYNGDDSLFIPYKIFEFTIEPQTNEGGNE